MMPWRRYPIPEEGPAQIETQAPDACDFDIDQHGDAGASATAFSAWLQAELLKVPESLRGTAEIHFYTSDHRVENADVKYLRPETDKEYAQRKAADRADAEKDRQRDIEQLARLKAKLGLE